MSLVIRLHEVNAKLQNLSLGQNGPSAMQALAARISVAVMLSEEAYLRQLATFPADIQPNIQEVRKAALPLLQQLESSDAELMAKQAAENVKMEELIRSVCKESKSLRKRIDRIDPSQKVDVLMHAQRLVPHCLSETVIDDVLSLIMRIAPDQRNEALELLPERFSQCDSEKRQVNLLRSLACSAVDIGKIIKEYLSLLSAVAPEYWEKLSLDKDNPSKWLSVCKKALPFFTESVLSNYFSVKEMLDIFKNENYTDALLKHVLLLKDYSSSTEDLGKIIARLEKIAEENRAAAVQNCITLLTPLDEKAGHVRRMFKILDSAVAKECLELAAHMQKKTPWLLMHKIKEHLEAATPDRRIEVKEAIANLLRSNRHSDDIDKELSSLSGNIRSKRELSNMTDVEATFLLNSLNKGVEGNEFKDAALNIPFANRLAILRAVQYLIPSPGMGEEKLALLATLGKLDAKGVNISKLIFENGAALEGQASKKYPEILEGLARSSVSSF